MSRAPAAILAAADRIVAAVPGAVFSGIVGDANHGYGYHLSRDELPATDYSVQLDLDRQGPGDAASALDISLPTDQMIACTSRLLVAATDDPLGYMRACREFAGTIDGSNTLAYDLAYMAYSYTWDDSHLWHIHVSGYRAYADDALAWDDFASAFTGSEEGDLMASEAQIRQWITEEVGKVLRAEGVSGAGDAHHMMSAGYSQMVVDGAGSVMRSEGVSGAADAGLMAGRYEAVGGMPMRGEPVTAASASSAQRLQEELERLEELRDRDRLERARELAAEEATKNYPDYTRPTR